MIRSSIAAGITLLAAVLALLAAPAASAQASRTWVSGVGDDANPCSRTAPCKTFAGAISKTANKGEISVLDPGGYGSVTITKSITLSGDGTLASILNAGVHGIIVNAGVNDVVIIRNISIHGIETGLNGIHFLAGGELHVEDCTIASVSGQGINFAPSGASGLFVSRTTITNANSGAIHVIPGAAGSATVSINEVTMQGNSRGLRAEGGSTVVVRDSVANGNNVNGFVAIAWDRPVDLTIENTVASRNGLAGIHAGQLSTVRISNTLVTGNNVGLEKAGTGSIVSFGNNRVHGNTTNGTPSATIGPL